MLLFLFFYVVRKLNSGVVVKGLFFKYGSVSLHLLNNHKQLKSTQPKELVDFSLGVLPLLEIRTIFKKLLTFLPLNYSTKLQ